MGLPCAHEWGFNLAGPLRWSDEYQGEASWLAAPFLRDLPQDVTVLHQRRDRVQAAVSLVRSGFFAEGDAYRLWAEEWLPDRDSPDPLARALGFHDAWHRLITDGLTDRIHISYRVEDLTEALLRRLCAFLGHIPTKPRLWDALTVSRSLNTNQEDSWTFPDSSALPCSPWPLGEPGCSSPRTISSIPSAVT